MSEVNTSVLNSLSPQTAPATGRANVSSADSLGQEDFLKLMTEQLKAQDPMNPGDTGDFLGQMAQFASVSGIQGLQQSVSDLATSLQSTQALQASSMVGRTVLVPASSTALGESGGVEGQVTPPAGSSNVTVNIVDAGGDAVHSMNMLTNGVDNLPFTWNGTLSDGTRAASGSYRIEAKALTAGESISAPVHIAGRVESVLLGGSESGLTLNIEGQGKVPAKDVIELRA